jgi:hypothetical protein
MACSRRRKEHVAADARTVRPLERNPHLRQTVT